ncbi:hypothetical protein CTI12_AA609930 [Artemisia annua]|uniref:Uncharacterized protein n=1 Tax=Artemisia annua TaxID=35608 RepID=A0A2U1K976_ARTAN|nr:hypothetical protein CTI12_AA609930 [Artemisia annua]
MAGHLVLLDELSFATNATLIREWMYVCFQTEVLEAEQSVVELETGCLQMVERIRQSEDLIRELEVLKSCIHAVKSVGYLKEILACELEKENRLKIMLAEARIRVRERRRYMLQWCCRVGSVKGLCVGDVVAEFIVMVLETNDESDIVDGVLLNFCLFCMYSSDKEELDAETSMLGFQSYSDSAYSEELTNFREHGHAGLVMMLWRWLLPGQRVYVLTCPRSECKMAVTILSKVFRYNLILPFGRQMNGLNWEKELALLNEVQEIT